MVYHWLTTLVYVLIQQIQSHLHRITVYTMYFHTYTCSLFLVNYCLYYWNFLLFLFHQQIPDLLFTERCVLSKNLLCESLINNVIWIIKTRGHWATIDKHTWLSQRWLREEKTLFTLWELNGSSFEQTWIPLNAPKDALCRVWLKLAQWFWRRRFLKDRAGPFICTNLNPLYPRMLCVKFGWNWSSDSWVEDFFYLFNVYLLLFFVFFVLNEITCCT